MNQNSVFSFGSDVSSPPLVSYPSFSSPPPVRSPSPPPTHTFSPKSFVEVELLPLTKAPQEQEPRYNPSDPTPEEEIEKERIEALIAFYAGIYDDLSLSKQINTGLLALLVLIEWAIYSVV